MAYTYTLLIHSYLRWIVVALGVIVLVRSGSGWRRRRAWEPADNTAQVRFVAALDVQMLVGLLLYIPLSPVTAAFRENMKLGMKDGTLRFFGVEHIAAMLIGVIVVHVGRAVGKRKVDAARHRTTAINTMVWMVLLLISIPWPGLQYGRPLFRMP